MKTKENKTTNYVHIEPNSDFYTDLQLIINSLEQGVIREDIIIGLKNTIEMGYSITQRFDSE